MSAKSAVPLLLRLLLPLGGGLSLVACGDTTRSPANSTGGGTSGQGGSSASPTASGLSVMGVLARPDGTCTVRSDGEAKLLGLGILDRALASSYPAALLLQSTRGERVALRTLDVSLESEGGTPYEAYSVSVTGFLDGAGAAGSAGFALATADLLPPALTQRLELGLLRLRLTLHAKPLSGSADDLATAGLVFPLELCEGCLVSYPEAARDPASPDDSYLCLTGAPAAESLGDAPQPCAPGLDAPVSCATCSDAVPLCRDPALNRTR